MKTITVNGKEYKKAPDEEHFGCKGCAIQHKPDSFCVEINCYEGGFILKKLPKKKSKNSKVEFLRYYRPVDQITGFARSDMGVTFYVRLNYKKRTMRVSCSVCDGDNFSKEHGKSIAKSRYNSGRYLEFPLNDYVDFKDTVLNYLRIVLVVEKRFPEFGAAVKQLRMRST